MTHPFRKASGWTGLRPYAAKFIRPIGDVSVVVELGVDTGYSFFTFAELFPEAQIYGVDNWTLGPDRDPETYVREWMEQYPNTELITGNSVEVAATFDKPIDVLHIDADHMYPSVKGDFDAWVGHVRSGGVVLFHDIKSFGSVEKFFNELDGVKTSTEQHNGLGAWYKP